MNAKKFYLLLMAIFMGLWILSPTKAHAQKVTVRIEQGTLDQAFQKIMKKSSIQLVYNTDVAARINCKAHSFEQKEVSEILNVLLANTSLTYQAKNKIYTIYQKPASATPPKKKGSITGLVLDDLGEPIIGAAILVKESGQGVVTGIDGEFELENIKGESVTLRVSYVGKKSLVKIAHVDTNVVIRMDEEVSQMEEVIVTGYGNIDSRRNTSAITSLKMDDIMMPGITSLTEALEGRVPDMMFSKNSGEIGATARLRIRGTSTILGNREPLWVLNGIPLSDPVDVTTEQLNDPDYINYIGNAISGINPEDIERIDILKDAAATALYGTRAANGVIVVTTKKGKIGAPSISYSTQLKMVMRPRYTDHNINLMNSQERVQFGKDLVDLHYQFPSSMTLVGYEGAYIDYINGITSFDEFQSIVNKYEAVNTDWFKILSHDALTQTHSLSVSGGTEKSRYYASLGYTSETPVVRTQSNERYTASMNLATDFTERFKANINLNASVQKKDYLPNDIKALDYAYNTTRALPAYNEDGSLYYYKRHAYDHGTRKGNNFYKYNYNMLNEMTNTSNLYDSNSFIATLDLQYNLKNFLDLTAAASYQRSASNGSTWYGEKTNYVAQYKNGEWDEEPMTGTGGKCDLPYGGIYDYNDNVSENTTLRFQANYHQSFGKDKQHLVSGNMGYEVNIARNNGTATQTRGYYKDRGMKYVTMTTEELARFPYYEKWRAENVSTLTSGKTNKLGGYLTLTYSYDTYLTLNLNGRFDASNKFGSRSNEKFLPVWSASGMVNFKEIFMKNVQAVDDLRMRFSYGITGNMLDGQTPNLLIKQGSMDTYYGENVSTVYAFPNPNLRWEETASTNFGLEASFFTGRLILGGDVYHKRTENAFTSMAVSLVNGISTYPMNGATLKNSGYSIYVSGYPIRSKDWTWYLSTNYSYFKNETTDVVNEYQLDDYLEGKAVINGESIGTFYSYKFLGLNPSNGTPMFDDYSDRRHMLEGKNMEEVVKMVMVKSGIRDPKFSGSLYSTLTWKQFSLNTNFQYSIGSKIRKFALYSDIMDGVSSENNVRKEFTERWQKPGDEAYTNYPSLISPSDPDYSKYRSHWSGYVSAEQQGFKAFASNIWNMYDRSDLRVVSGNYLKLSQLTLRYSFPAELLKGCVFKSASVDFSTSNVFTICSKKLDGQDPSQTGFGASTVLSTRPTYTLGVRFSL